MTEEQSTQISQLAVDTHVRMIIYLLKLSLTKLISV